MSHVATEIIVAVLILISVVLILWESTASLPPQEKAAIDLANDLITSLFVVELILRYYAERRKRRFFRRYWVDIIAVLPLFRAFRILRVLRLLRLFRLGIILSRRLGSFSRFFHLVRIEYVMVIVGIVIIVLMSVATIPQVENHHDFRSLEHSFWFSVMTLVAGEPIGGMPQSFVGRATTLALMLTGLSVFAIMAGTVSAVMIDSLSNLKLRTMEIEDLDGHVVVCGWNAAGELLINELLLERAERGIVVIADRDDLDQIELFRRSRDHLFFLRGDYTLIDVLKRAGVDRAKSSVLLADDSGDDRSPQDRDARTVLAAMLIEKLNASIFTTVQLLNRDNEASLRKVGVEEIVVSEEMVGGILASVVKSPGIVSVLDELLTASYGHQFFKSAVPADLVGKTVADAMQVLKERYNATLLAVDSIGENEEMIVNPPSDLILHDAHRIVVAADQPLDSMR